jgi:hypothetical protein
MRAGQVDTHGENDLLVFWDTFNKSYSGRRGRHGWNRGILVCLDNKDPKIHIRV